MKDRFLRWAEVPWHAVRLYRLSRRLLVRGHPVLAHIVASVNRIITGVEIHPNAVIGSGLVIQHGVGNVIGEGAVIGDRCWLHQSVTVGVSNGVDDVDERRRYPKIGNDVRIYAGAVILGPITVGDDSVVGANATVLADVEPGSVVVGSPARKLAARERTIVTE